MQSQKFANIITLRKLYRPSFTQKTSKKKLLNKVSNSPIKIKIDTPKPRTDHSIGLLPILFRLKQEGNKETKELSKPK